MARSTNSRPTSAGRGAPDGVIQEVYGHLCVHYAIRSLMHSAATDSGHGPDRFSFTRTLRAARRTTASQPSFSPRTQNDAHRRSPRRAPPRRPASPTSRINPRVVKRKMSVSITSTPHRNAPQPPPCRPLGRLGALSISRRYWKLKRCWLYLTPVCRHRSMRPASRGLVAGRLCCTVRFRSLQQPTARPVVTTRRGKNRTSSLLPR